MKRRAIPDLVSMIGALIGEPSISCADPSFDQGNLGVVSMLAEWAEQLGFDVEIDPVGSGKANLIATLNPPGGSPSTPGGLVLSGHTDTVPCNPERWRSDPFRATERDERIYGLGSADMKSFLALMLEAASRIEARDLRHPLVLLGTADEESSMSGARKILERNRKLGRHALIGEPTGLRPVRMHKGIMMASIVIHGQSGHSSDPSLGANAIEGMQAILAELLSFRHELKTRYRNPAFRIDYPTLNLGSIHGGDNPNRICGHCELRIDLRPLPGMDMDELYGSLERRLASTLDASPGLTLEMRPLFASLPAFETPAEATIVEACENLTGSPASAVAFGTEAPFLDGLGMETIILGPGHIDQAHQPDEYLPLNHIRPCLDILDRLIRRFCIEA